MNRKLTGQLLTLLLLCGTFVAESQARVYLYQMPDGSRLLSDRPLLQTQAKLVRRSYTIENMGRYAAHQTLRYQRNKNRLEPLINRIADEFDVEQALVKAVIHTESYYNPHATSRKGASGLMQLMPATAEKYGVYDLYNPEQNIKAGVQHLRYLLSVFPYKLNHAIAAYNAGIDAVKRYKGIPPYPETRRYVRKVLSHLEDYRSSY